jgi:hypothetical protein
VADTLEGLRAEMGVYGDVDAAGGLGAESSVDLKGIE